MNYQISNNDVSQEFLEKTLRDFYCREESCKGWETNVITQPKTVNNIMGVGAARIAAGLGVGDVLPDRNLAGKIDHTLLKPDATPDEIKKLCDEAAKFKFASVCINPGYVTLCYNLLKGTGVKVCTVIGFPLGSTTTEVKKFEAEQAIQNGADEIDMVMNVGQHKQGNYDYIFNDINQVVLTAKKKGVICEVILETALLSDE